MFLAIATFAVYFRATKNPFVNYDDTGYVTENDNVQQGLTRATLRWALTSTDCMNWHPLTWVSHALDCQLFGLNPAGHHFSSVLLHVLNVVILFLLLLRVTGAVWRSLLVAALFAMHPINVESVAWVAERKNVLSMFFFLLTLAAYGWYARHPKIERYLMVVILFFLGLTAKPMIVTLPFVLLLVDFWPLQRVLNVSPPSTTFPVPQASLKELVSEKLPLLLLSAASCVMTLIAQRSAMNINEGLAFGPRVKNAIYAYAIYVVKAFWPTHLASFYPYEGLRMATWVVLLYALFLVVLTVLVWRVRSSVYVPVGWLWFLGTLVPVIGFVQVGGQAMADRYAYLPFLGIFVIVVWGVGDLVRKFDLNPRLFLAAAACILAIFSIMTWRQIRVWRSSYDLWSHALQVTKDDFMAEDYVGSAILVENFEKTGQRASDAAVVHFKNAIRINPNDAIGHMNLGADLQEHGHYQEAIDEYRTTLGLTRDPHLIVKLFIDLGAAYQSIGDFDTALRYDREAIKLDPQNRVAFTNLGKLGMARRIRQLSDSATAKPSPKAYLELGQLEQAAGEIPRARESFTTALKLNPKFTEAKDALSNLEDTANSTSR